MYSLDYFSYNYGCHNHNIRTSLNFHISAVSKNYKKHLISLYSSISILGTAILRIRSKSCLIQTQSDATKQNAFKTKVC